MFELKPVSLTDVPRAGRPCGEVTQAVRAFVASGLPAVKIDGVSKGQYQAFVQAARRGGVVRVAYRAPALFLVRKDALKSPAPGATEDGADENNLPTL